MTRAELLKLHTELTGKASALMAKKNADYTGKGGTFSNFESAKNFNIHPIQGALIRLTDKLQRVNSFIENGVLEVTGESIEDTIIDMINYPILIAGMFEEERGKLANKEPSGLVFKHCDNCGMHKLHTTTDNKDVCAVCSVWSLSEVPKTEEEARIFAKAIHMSLAEDDVEKKTINKYCYVCQENRWHHVTGDDDSCVVCSKVTPHKKPAEFEDPRDCSGKLWCTNCEAQHDHEFNPANGDCSCTICEPPLQFDDVEHPHHR